MSEKDNPNKNAELSMEQGASFIDGIINNLAPPEPEENIKPLDRVLPPTEIKRIRERER